MEKQCMLSTCRKFPQGSIHHQHFCEPQRPTFSLPWKMSGTYHARQNVLKGFNFFFLPRAIIKSIEVWVFSSLLSLLSDILAPPLTGSSALHMLGCCERGRMVWEGGGHMAWLIFTALWHHSSKPCFPEGCRICLAAWLWAASQCPSGRTAGRHFLQIDPFISAVELKRQLTVRQFMVFRRYTPEFKSRLCYPLAVKLWQVQ